MASDSEDLVKLFENFFNIKIPDKESEKMNKLQDTVDYISSIINFDKSSFDLKSHIFNQLKQIIIELNITINPITIDQKIFDIIHYTNLSVWKEISEKIDLELPIPKIKGKIGKFFDTLFNIKFDYENTTFDRFIDLICAINYKKLLINSKFHNEYEILIAVMGCTISLSGINPYDASADKSYTNDLGID